MKNIIEAKNLTKKYQDGNSTVMALHDVSICLPVNESMVIIGTSGSGKSTLLQLFGGLDYPTSGSIIVNGKEINKLTDNELSTFRNKTIGFVFQFFNLHDYLTAKENVAMPLLLMGLNQIDAFKKAEKLLKKVHMEHRINHTPKKMSGGEMQRVAIARALANDPKIIMADEPTGNLDRANAENVLQIFNEIDDQDGVSILMITHDESMANKYQHTLHLDKGKLK